MNPELEAQLAKLPKFHPHHYAQVIPDKPAVIMAGIGGAPQEVVTFKQLDERSNQMAQLFRAKGLKRFDSIAIFMGNNARYHEILWGAQRAGLRFVTASSKLSVSELEYILTDSAARLIFVSPELVVTARAVAARLQGNPDLEFYMVSDPDPEFPFRSLEAERAKYPTTPIADQSAGSAMLYSSGTTGRPKGIKRLPPLPGGPQPLADFENYDGYNQLSIMGMALFGFKPFETVYLSPAPLYHAAPVGWTMAVHSIGGTVVIMEKFDERKALELIEKHKCTTGQFVPTHFIRMLKLPEAERKKYNVSSLKGIFHAAAPCPVPVKQAMIDWWGPIVHEYYGGSEGNGLCFITAADWLRKPGTVGRPFPPVKLHIWDEEKGVEITEPGREGAVYLEGGGRFEYNNDPGKTAESTNKMGWTTLGDVGYVDSEGFLFLTDRKAFMIISGGVNIYPQEIENALIVHPKVADVAVIGAPDPEMGERVVAVVQPARWEDAGVAFSKELEAYLRERISHVKVPKEISFSKELPRHDTGKLYKRLIKDAYYGKADASYKGVIPGAKL